MLRLVPVWILPLSSPVLWVSGHSPEQDAQPFLRVAEGGLEKWWWLDETPQGFCPDSAYLAIHRLDIQPSLFSRPAFAAQCLYSTICLLHIFCHYCRLL